MYYALRHNRSEPIADKAPTTAIETETLDSKTASLLDMVTKLMASFLELFSLSLHHRPGTPWYQAMVKRENIISGRKYQRLLSKTDKSVTRFCNGL
nr:hypothetical protein [Enterobacter hormaechei]